MSQHAYFQRNLPKLAVIAGMIISLLCSLPAQADNALRIAAVVNDDIISMYDVSTRMRIALHSAHLPTNRATSKRMLPQVLRTLIDERLQEQEAKTLGVTLSDEDLSRAIQSVESNNHMPPGGLKQLADAIGVPYSAMTEQVRISALWIKTVGRKFSRQVHISDTDVTDQLKEMRDNLGKPEHFVSEIYLPYNAAKNKDEVTNLADDLVAQLRKGAPFVVAARQFSRSPTAIRGGSLGWVPQGELEPELDRALAHMAEGEISTPIPTQNGYYILKLTKRRTLEAPDPGEAKTVLSQIKLPIVGEKALSPADQTKVINYIHKSIRGCKDFNAYGKTLGTTGSGPLGSLKQKDMPYKLQKTVGNLDVGQPSQLVDLANAPTILMVCERVLPSALPSKEVVKKMMRRQRLERSGQRFLNDLRRNAVIDVRM